MPSDVPFRELRTLLEEHGWNLDRVRGSHHNFNCPGKPTFQVPVDGNKVSYVYLRKAQRFVEQQREKTN